MGPYLIVIIFYFYSCFFILTFEHDDIENGLERMLVALFGMLAPVAALIYFLHKIGLKLYNALAGYIELSFFINYYLIRDRKQYIVKGGILEDEKHLKFTHASIKRYRSRKSLKAIIKMHVLKKVLEENELELIEWPKGGYIISNRKKQKAEYKS